MRDLAGNPRERPFERFSGALIVDGKDGRVSMACQS